MILWDALENKECRFATRFYMNMALDRPLFRLLILTDFKDVYANPPSGAGGQKETK